MKKINFIFIGNGPFAAQLLDNLVKLKFIPVLVITQIIKEKNKNYLPSIKEIIQKNKLSFIQVIDINQKINYLKKQKKEIFIVSDYGQKLASNLLKIPYKGCLNLHPSLLPLYRGPSPIQFAILNGESKTGVTLIKMDEQIDHGPIIAQEKLSLSTEDNYLSLLSKLANLGAYLIVKKLPLYLQNKLKLTPQNDQKATYSFMIKKIDGKINWQEKAIDIERKVRAFYPWPSAYTIWRNKLLKIIDSDIYPNNFHLEPGRVFQTENKEIAVATSDKSLIINKLQLEGKKELPASEFIKGYPQIIGSILK